MKRLIPLAAALALLAGAPAHAQSLNAAEKDLMDAYGGCKSIEKGATKVIFSYMGFVEQPSVGMVKQLDDHAVAVAFHDAPDQNGRMVHQCISMAGPAPGSDALIQAVRADAQARGFTEGTWDSTEDGTGKILPFRNQAKGEVITLIVSPANAQRSMPMLTLSNVWTAQ